MESGLRLDEFQALDALAREFASSCLAVLLQDAVFTKRAAVES
jgi:hypothetical protein